MSEQIPPCPFCGDEPAVDMADGGPWLLCAERACPIAGLRFTPEAWNRRAAPPATQAYLDWFRTPFTGSAEQMGEQEGRLRAAMLAEWPGPSPAAPAPPAPA